MGILDRVHLSNNILDDVAELQRRMADIERFMLGGSSVMLPDGALPTPSASAGGVPIGGIILWSGAARNTTEFVICDGTNGTPDLKGLVSPYLFPYFPTMPITDSFIRDNVGPPPSDAWAMDGTEAHGLVVDTNQCAGESAGRNVAWRNEPLGFTVFVSVRVAVLPADGDTIRIYAGMSAQDAASGDGYMIEWTYRAGTDDDLKLYRIDAGAATLLNSGSGFNVTANGEIGIAFFPGVQLGFTKETPASDWIMQAGDTDVTYQQIGFVGMDIEGTTARVDQVCIQSLCHLMRVA